MKYGWLISGIIIISLLVLSIYFIFPKNITSDNIKISGLPAYALASEKIKEAYLFAKENPEALDGINCYCGCMQMMHNGRIHSEGLHDCFLNPNSSDGFEIHGSECDMCVNDALQVKSLLEENKTKEEIKAIIDSKYVNVNIDH